MKVAILCIGAMAFLLADTSGQGTFDIKCGVEELKEEVLTMSDTLEGKFDTLDGKIDTLNGKIDTMDVKIDTLDVKIDTLDGKNDTLDGKIMMARLTIWMARLIFWMASLTLRMVGLTLWMARLTVWMARLTLRMERLTFWMSRLTLWRGRSVLWRERWTMWKGKLDDLKQLLHNVIANQGPQWVVIQRRGQFGNPADFFAKSMADYKTGFGNVDKDFWLGLAELARQTKDGKWEMQVDLVDYAGKAYRGDYHKFRVGAGPRYELVVGEYDSSKSTMGKDVFIVHNKMAFSTKDVDQDTKSDGSCSNKYGHGGWWYQACVFININGENTGNDNYASKGMRVNAGGQVMMKESKMKMKKIM
eukprot:GFUD01050553.1.p1 GENE.GFUD01050553.1~~GFUD01050553.1.p1  ORF type:complete len:360 (-),score=110.91 GFUD01050553.1:68-1147(-)